MGSSSRALLLWSPWGCGPREGTAASTSSRESPLSPVSQRDSEPLPSVTLIPGLVPTTLAGAPCRPSPNMGAERTGSAGDSPDQAQGLPLTRRLCLHPDLSKPCLGVGPPPGQSWENSCHPWAVMGMRPGDDPGTIWVVGPPTSGTSCVPILTPQGELPVSKPQVRLKPQRPPYCQSPALGQLVLGPWGASCALSGKLSGSVPSVGSGAVAWAPCSLGSTITSLLLSRCRSGCPLGLSPAVNRLP